MHHPAYESTENCARLRLQRKTSVEDCHQTLFTGLILSEIKFTPGLEIASRFVGCSESPELNGRRTTAAQ